MGILGISDGVYLGVYLSVAKDTAGSSRGVNQAMGYFSTLLLFPILLGNKILQKICFVNPSSLSIKKSFIGPIVAGAIYQHFGGYELAYYQGSVACLLCGLIQLLYPGGEVLKFIRRTFRSIC
jgi:hypothetical protein